MKKFNFKKAGKPQAPKIPTSRKGVNILGTVKNNSAYMVGTAALNAVKAKRAKATAMLMNDHK